MQVILAVEIHIRGRKRKRTRSDRRHHGDKHNQGDSSQSKYKPVYWDALTPNERKLIDDYSSASTS